MAAFFRICIVSLGVLVAGLAPAGAFSISLVYENPDDAFFTPQARATLNQAAADVSAVITTTLASLNTNSFLGTNGSTSIAANWTATYYDPYAAEDFKTLDTFDFAAGEYRIFVGRNVPENPNVAAVGGPAGVGINFEQEGEPSEFAGAVADLQNASNAGMTRGGPVYNTLNGSVSLGAENVPFGLQFGYTVGSLSINPNVSWHFDLTAPEAGKIDFYSVALHEILHAVGFGTSPAWAAAIDGTNWLGENVISLLGSGTNLVSPGGDHLTQTLTGHPLINGEYDYGINQQVAMAPGIAPGARNYLTDVDVAFLRDLGWETIAVPEPSTWVMMMLGFGVVVVAVGRSKRRVS